MDGSCCMDERLNSWWKATSWHGDGKPGLETISNQQISCKPILILLCCPCNARNLEKLDRWQDAVIFAIKS